MNKQLGLSGLVALVVAVGVLYLFPSTSTNTTVVQPEVRTIIEKVIEEKLGSVVGPNLPADRDNGGVRKVSNRVGLNTGTSTLCALPAPHGTSTPLFFAVKLNSAYGTATAANQSPVIDLFRSSEDRATTTAFATSTANVIGEPYRPDIAATDAIVVIPYATTSGAVGTVGGAAEEVFVASSTSAFWTYGPQDLNGGSRFDFFVAKISNSPSGDYRGYSPTGYCQGEWLVID